MRRRFSTILIGLTLAMPAALRAQPAPQPEPGAQAEPQSRPLIEDDAIKRMLMEGPRGSLAITVAQGTAGGPPISELDLKVDLYHQNDPIYEMLAATDKSGVVLMGDLPVAIVVRPVVRAEYGGVSYLEVGPPMGPESPDAVVKLTVYETTDQMPAWRVAMRHVMVSRVPQGCVVEETMIVENPTDSTWVGGQPDENDNRTTVRAGLPQGATDVQLISGFHGWCCTKHVGRELAVQMPLMPGQTTYRFAYLVPPSEGASDLRFAAPAQTDSMVLFVPDDGTEAEPATLTQDGTEMIESTRMRLYQGQAIAPGTEAGLRLASMRTGAQPGQGGQSGGGLGNLPWIGLAVVVLGLLGALLLWMRRA